MKELEKVKRISIVSTLFILVILVGVLTFERPKNMYAIDTVSTLEKLVDNDNFVSIEEMNDPNMVLIDVRSPFEYNKSFSPTIILFPPASIFSTYRGLHDDIPSPLLCPIV